MCTSVVHWFALTFTFLLALSYLHFFSRAVAVPCNYNYEKNLLFKETEFASSHCLTSFKVRNLQKEKKIPVAWLCELVSFLIMRIDCIQSQIWIMDGLSVLSQTVQIWYYRVNFLCTHSSKHFKLSIFSSKHYNILYFRQNLTFFFYPLLSILMCYKILKLLFCPSFKTGDVHFIWLQHKLWLFFSSPLSYVFLQLSLSFFTHLK